MSEEATIEKSRIARIGGALLLAYELAAMSLIIYYFGSYYYVQYVYQNQLNPLALQACQDYCKPSLLQSNVTIKVLGANYAKDAYGNEFAQCRCRFTDKLGNNIQDFTIPINATRR